MKRGWSRAFEFITDEFLAIGATMVLMRVVRGYYGRYGREEYGVLKNFENFFIVNVWKFFVL